MRHKIHWHCLSVLCIFFLLCLGSMSCSRRAEPEVDDRKPNILLLVADDLGYADLGCYGGDISTPNIDGLATRGIRFSRFHTSPMCAPTRAMLLSGNDNHIAGMGLQGVVTEEFGYEGRLTDRIVTIPELLREAGYFTCMAGKWHLGMDSLSNPHQKGFDRSFALLEGAGNHYSNQSVLRPGKATYTEDGASLDWRKGDYSTDFYTDKIIEYIDLNRDKRQAFFAFAAFTSPHWPLQVDNKYRLKYEGRYDEGYDVLKERRLESLIRAGMIPTDAILPPSHDSVIPWDSLSEEEKEKEARKMELYAGMVDNLDHNIGRIIAYLKEIGEYDNTLIVFMSDNGAAYRDFIHSKDYAFLREYYNDDYENMGREDSYISYGPQWAEAGSSPFRYFKDYATQGGINTPMIICGPRVRHRNEIHHGFSSVQDLAPTFYELAGIAYPEIFKEREVYPLRGSSLLPFLSGKSGQIHSEDYVFALEHNGNAMLRKGKWKITNFIRPFETGNFALYDLDADIGEQNDLRKAEPAKYEEMLMEWAKFSDEIHLQTPPPISELD
jgi:arylsulfatase A-like enzyme